MAGESNTYPASDAQAPGREGQSTKGSRYPSSTLSSKPNVGALSAPGTYPTPELLLHPTGRYQILDQVSSFTSDTIQAALDSLGEYGTLYLPQASRWAVSSAIILKSYQELATWGYPTDETSMALLKAESACKPHILNCLRATSTRIRNLRIDGRRERFGYDPQCYGMVALGGEGAQNQVIDQCILKHPRHWGCCHAYGGGAQNIRITNNFIGPCGHQNNQGEQGDRQATGIKFAANNGLIAGNYIVDATHAAMLLHGASGTLVTSNTIVTQTRAGVVGIRMFYHPPNKGNHGWTRVINNTIRMEGVFLKVGVAQGDQVLWEPTPKAQERVIQGATVM